MPKEVKGSRKNGGLADVALLHVQEGGLLRSIAQQFLCRPLVGDEALDSMAVEHRADRIGLRRTAGNRDDAILAGIGEVKSTQ